MEGRKKWFSKRCDEARARKEEAWKRWRRKRQLHLWYENKQERNKYPSISKEEKKNFKKIYIVKTCEDQPKLFLRFINGKLGQNVGTEGLKVSRKRYNEVTEVMNETTIKDFTRESKFDEPE